jgi:hypothetical protein
MKKEINLAQLGLTPLNFDDSVAIIGGEENMFYDAGVAVGRAMVRAWRWWQSVEEENMRTSQSLLLL